MKNVSGEWLSAQAVKSRKSFCREVSNSSSLRKGHFKWKPTAVCLNFYIVTKSIFRGAITTSLGTPQFVFCSPGGIHPLMKAREQEALKWSEMKRNEIKWVTSLSQMFRPFLWCYTCPEVTRKEGFHCLSCAIDWYLCSDNKCIFWVRKRCLCVMMETCIEPNSGHIASKRDVKWSMNNFNYFHLAHRGNELILHYFSYGKYLL